METKFNHKLVEEGKNQKWIDKEYFSTHDQKKKPFSIILPPPNVTGKLHLGHAWDGYIQDTVIRYKKIQGFDVMWVPGMDHAGIATQAKVEEKLRNEGMPSRHEMGREKFLEKVWDWKEEYASTIRKQWGTLGLALDYKNERFTMDQGLSDAVQKVFVEMFNKDLIYRGVRAVNWDPKLQTVLSNIEVINKDTSSKMYYIKYDDLEVATTRPETMFSDVAVAINPNDDLMKHHIGKTVVSPLTGQKLPVIGDTTIEIGKGTGAMKVSAHAAMDIDIIKANGMEVKESITKEGLMNSLAGDMEGIDRFEARIKVVELLESKGVIVKAEDITNAVGYSERSGEVVETLLMPQWFVNMEPMAKAILDNMCTEDKVKFHPLRFEDTLKTWMEEIHDWCISRQLWWGHRIPAWYKGEEIKVQVESPGEGWYQDEDVLDTWFSSGIAPFTFLGWPNSNEMVERYYPTSLLVTGYDIIFFWVARMYFQSVEFMGEKPFNDVLIHGLIRAEDGRKMSKSLGNGIDPMDVIDEFGSDSLRWFLLTNSTPGQDLRYSTEKVRFAWNLQNKLWNISRYILDIMPDTDNEITDADKWIVNKLINLEAFINKSMGSFDFTLIGKELNKFIMEDFSSWYIEFTKSSPNKKLSIVILKKLLLILHPFMPMITDHIFMEMGEELLESNVVLDSLGKADYIDLVIEITKALREFRETSQVSNKETLKIFFSTKLDQNAVAMVNKLTNTIIEENNDSIIPIGELTMFVKLSDEMKSKEEKRIADKKAFLESEINRAVKMLANEGFISRAPEAKIQAEKDKLDRFKTELAELK